MTGLDVVAQASVNHNGSLEMARWLVCSKRMKKIRSVAVLSATQMAPDLLDKVNTY